MATITPYPFVRHFRGEQLSYVVRFKNGHKVSSGQAATFWFRPLNTQVAEVPLDDQELPFTFQAKSADFQDVTVSGIVTYRIADPDVTVDRLNFAVDVVSGNWDEDPREKIDSLLTQLTQQYAWDWLSNTSLENILQTGVADLRGVISAGLAAEPAVAELGLTVVSSRVSSIKPRADVEKALTVPKLELLNQEMDRAVATRRAEAARQDAAIAKQEQDNKIALAEQRRRLIDTEAANTLRQQEAENDRVELSTQSTLMVAETDAKSVQMRGEAQAAAERAKMEVYTDVDQKVLYARALEALAGNLQSIGSLAIGQEVVNKLINEIEAQ